MSEHDGIGGSNVGLHYVLGVSLGMGGMPTALAVLEQETVAVPPARSARTREVRLRHLERLELGASYPALADRVFQIVDEVKAKEEAKEGTALVVDITGCGRSGAALLKSRSELSPLFVTVCLGADEIETAHCDWRVGKAELV